MTLWDAETAAPRATLRGHSASVGQPVFSLDGATLYTASGDGTVIAWDISGTRRLGRSFKFTHDRAYDPVLTASRRFSADGRLIAVGLKKKGIQLWHAADLTPAGRPLLETGGEVKGSRSARTGARSQGHLERHGHALGYGVTIAPAPTIRYWLVFCWRREPQRGRDCTLATAGSSGVSSGTTGAMLDRVGGHSVEDVALADRASRRVRCQRRRRQHKDLGRGPAANRQCRCL